MEVFRKATLVVADSKDQARLEAGDFVKPLDAGVLRWSDVRELASLLIGRYPGREAAADVTVFKSLGLGVEDVALAARLVPLARERGVGRELFSALHTVRDASQRRSGAPERLCEASRTAPASA